MTGGLYHAAPLMDLPAAAHGILPSQWLRKALDAGVVRAGDRALPETSVQPASLDLRLGATAYRLRCSFLPESQSVAEKLADLAMGELDLRGDGAILERNRPYLVPLQEELRLPAGLRAKANPKSSTGRLDVFTRVITDHSHTFDEIRTGYGGRLYLEVVPRSFTIRVHEGLALNQLRLVAGNPRCSDEEIRAMHATAPALFHDGRPLRADDFTVANGMFLSIDLSGFGGETEAYRAKKNSHEIDLARRDYAWRDYWEEVHREPGDRLILEPEEFYLVRSAEGVAIGPDYAAEMVAYDPTSGELRTHYAGFFDPGFGFGPGGTRAALEVRAHDVPFMLEDRQRVCKLRFERMLEPPDILYGSRIGSSYQGQDLPFSKHFRSHGAPDPRQLSLGG